MTVLVTGAAGFIGAATCQALLNRGDEVVGVDNLNDYYDPQLKKDRLNLFKEHEKFQFEKVDIVNIDQVNNLFTKTNPDKVINLAAQPGVRYSLINPYPYIKTNITGFFNILDSCKNHEVRHLVYASSSSVYGANKKIPYSIADRVDNPVSLYAASKKSNELIAHSYSSLYQLPTTGLRFFTVYGPWGRPDMTPSLFVRKMILGEEIEVFNHGNHSRDYTYIDDVVEGVLSALDKKVDGGKYKSDSDTSERAPSSLYNIGNNQPVNLEDLLIKLETISGIKCVKKYMPLQSGDVVDTFADIKESERDLGFSPKTNIDEGLEKYIAWHKEYYGRA